jgi:pimeloyl-ACP methyl ester carboxylesterase
VAAADGTPIVYEVRGEGDPALVFIHCWACNRSFWREQLDVFAEDHTIVALDLPGHGASGRDREEWTLAGYADDVVRVVDALDLDRVVLVGHSMGGPVSLLAAARLGDRAQGVICVDALHDAGFVWREEAARQWIAGFEQDFEGAMRNAVAGMVPWDSVLRDWIAAQGLLADREAMTALIHEFSRFDLAAALSAAGAPVRCINAAPYGEYSLPTAVETNRRYADFDATIMEGVGHYLHLERPEEFNRRMRDLLAEIAGAGAGRP